MRTPRIEKAFDRINKINRIVNRSIFTAENAEKINHHSTGLVSAGQAGFEIGIVGLMIRICMPKIMLLTP